MSNRDGHITSWLNELAFVPVDYNRQAPVDEWSVTTDAARSFSQQCVGGYCRSAASNWTTPCHSRKLKRVQALMEGGDYRAAKIYQTIGTYLGYAIAHYADFYEFSHVLVLGRVTSGPGGDIILKGAQEVLQAEFPELFSQIHFYAPDEKDKRHGQAIAAASLPVIGRQSPGC